MSKCGPTCPADGVFQFIYAKPWLPETTGMPGQFLNLATWACAVAVVPRGTWAAHASGQQGEAVRELCKSVGVVVFVEIILIYASVS